MKKRTNKNKSPKLAIGQLRRHAYTKRSEIYRKQPSCKKVCSPKESHYEKGCKIKAIQVNLVPNPSGMWRMQHRIIAIKICAIDLPSH